MNEPTTPLAAELKALAVAHAALSRDDVDGFTAIMADDVVWTEPSDSPGAGVTRGIEAVRAHFRKHRGNWAEGSCEARQQIVVGDRRIVQLVHVHVRLKGEADFREGTVAEVYTWADGKVVDVHIFFDERAAFAWARGD